MQWQRVRESIPISHACDFYGSHGIGERYAQRSLPGCLETVPTFPVEDMVWRTLDPSKTGARRKPT